MGNSNFVPSACPLTPGRRVASLIEKLSLVRLPSRSYLYFILVQSRYFILLIFAHVSFMPSCSHTKAFGCHFSEILKEYLVFNFFTIINNF